MFVFRDHEFPVGHAGIKMNGNKLIVDVMDCLDYICASQSAAFVACGKWFKRESLGYTVWSNATIKRQRKVCDFSIMIKALSAINTVNAHKLAMKLSMLTSIVVSSKDTMDYVYEMRIHQANSEKLNKVPMTTATSIAFAFTFTPSSITPSFSTVPVSIPVAIPVAIPSTSTAIPVATPTTAHIIEQNAKRYNLLVECGENSKAAALLREMGERRIPLLVD